MHVINYSLLKENNIFRNMEGNVTSSSNRSKWVSPKLPMVSWEHPGASRSTPRLRFGKLPTLIVKCMVPIEISVNSQGYGKRTLSQKRKFPVSTISTVYVMFIFFWKNPSNQIFLCKRFVCWSLPWLQGPHFCRRVDD